MSKPLYGIPIMRVFVALFVVMGTVCNLILPASDVVRSPCFKGSPEVVRALMLNQQQPF